MKIDTGLPPQSVYAPKHLGTGRDIILFRHKPPPESIPGSGLTLSESPFKAIITGVNAHAISPRDIQKLSLDLYANGLLSWEEHEDLSFQVELHPDFPKTIGALTGEKPLPDQPKDFVKEWEQRLDFQERFAFGGEKQTRALHILSVLRRIDSPTTIDT